MHTQVSKLYKTLVWNGEISLAVLDTTAFVNEAISRHGLSATAAAALGRTLTASAYLCSWLKNDGSLSVALNGGGAGGKLFVSGDGALNMRGYVQNPHVSLPPRADGKLDVGGFVGKNGTLDVARDDGRGIPFTGTSPLVSGEIAEDFSYYFLISEQRPTAIALGVKIGPDGNCLGAGGVFLQPLPFASEESISRAETEIRRYAAVSADIETRGAEGILRELGAETWETRDIFYRCHCTRRRAERLIIAMGKNEAESLLKEEGKIAVHCDYCNTDYTFGDEEVAELFRGKTA